jgi:hypothetical protein
MLIARAGLVHAKRERCGTTLVEVLVALVLAGLVLATATLSVLHQQRTASRVAALWSAQSQLGPAATLLPGELAQLAFNSGDLVAGEASDTAVELRAPVASSISCDSAVGSATLIPATADSLLLGGVASAPRVGDSLWWFPEGDSSWRGRRVVAVGARSVQCTGPVSVRGSAVRLTLDSPDTVPAGSPIRVTRMTRYSVYRSGDGSWQLGRREWTEPARQLAAIQPVAGPFLRLGRGAGTPTTGFRYFDAAGQELVTPVNVALVRRIRATALVLAPAHEPGQDSTRRDSADVALGNARAP